MSAERKTAIKFRAQKKAALRFLAITSVAITLPYSAQIAEKIVGGSYSIFLGAIMSYLLYLVIDVPLSNGLEYREETAGKTTGGKWWKPWSFTSAQTRRSITTLLVVVTLILTGGMSFIANTLISDYVAPAQDASQLQEARKENRQAYDATLSELKTDIEQAKVDLKNAPAEGSKLVQSAIGSGSAEMQKLWKNGNGWIRNDRRRKYREYREKIQKAERDSAALVSSRRQYVADLLGEKKNHLAQADSVNTATDNAFFFQASRSEKIFSGLWKFLLGLDVAAVIVIVLCHIWLVAYFNDGGTLPKAKNSFAEAMEEWRNRQWDAIVDRLFRRKENDEKTDGNDEKHPTETAPKYAPVRGVEPDDIPVGRLLRLIESQGQQIQVISEAVEGLKTPTVLRPMDGIASEINPVSVPSEKPVAPTKKRRRKTPRKPDGKRACKHCNNPFEAKTARAQYCSDACRKNHHDKTRRKKVAM